MNNKKSNAPVVAGAVLAIIVVCAVALVILFKKGVFTADKTSASVEVLAEEYTNEELADAYKAAVESLKKNNAEESLALFTELGDYEDAAHYVEILTKYQDAVKLADEFDYEGAIALLNDCGLLFDSKGRVADYTTIIEMSEKLMAGELEEAKSLKGKVGSLTKKDLTAAEMHAKIEAMVALAVAGDNDNAAALVADVMSHELWVENNWGEKAVEAELTDSENGAVASVSYASVAADGNGTVSVLYTDEAKKDFFYSLTVNNGTEDVTIFVDKDGVVME